MNLKPLQNLWSSWWSRSRTRRLCMHEKPSGYKVLHQIPAAAAGVQWGDCSTPLTGLHGLCQMYQRWYGPPHQSQPPLQDSQKLVQAINAWYWNKKEKSPTKPELPDLLESSPKQKSDSNKFWQQVQQRFFPVQAERTATLALPRARAQFWQKKSTTPNLSSKLRKDGKLTPQECQCHLDNMLCLFCGTAWHITKDCQKSSSASTKAQVSKSDQDKSMSSGTDSKKDWAVLKTLHEPRIVLNSLVQKTLTLNTSTLSNPDSLTLSLTSHTLLWSWSPLWIPIFWLLHWFCVFFRLSISWLMAFCLSSSDSLMEPPIPVISQALDLQIHFPTGESQNLTFTSLHWPELHDCTRILLASPATIPDWWVLEQSFSGNCRNMNPRAHPSVRHFHCQHHFLNFWTLSWDLPNPVLLVTLETPKSNPH